MHADARLDEAGHAAFRRFFEDRLRFILGRMGYAHDELNAVLGARSGSVVPGDNPVDVLARVSALHEVRESPDLSAGAP